MTELTIAFVSGPLCAHTPPETNATEEGKGRGRENCIVVLINTEASDVNGSTIISVKRALVELLPAAARAAQR